MRFRLPRPLHGCVSSPTRSSSSSSACCSRSPGRQLLDTIRSRSEVASFREAVNHELGRDLGNYEYIVTLAKPLGIRPIRDTVVHHVPSDKSFCQPLLAGPASSSSRT